MDLVEYVSQLGIDPEVVSRLLELSELLTAEGPKRGLISKRDQDRVLERHVIDSLRAVRGVEPSDRTAYDLGSGAGLPGLAVAIARPGLHVDLVESRRSRSAWLERVVAELGIPNAGVQHARIEDLAKPADICFARALAPLERSWQLAAPLLRPAGRLVYFAGQRFDPAELQRLALDGRIVTESGLDSYGPIVIIGIRDSRPPAAGPRS